MSPDVIADRAGSDSRRTEEGAGEEGLRVALVNMPWAAVDRPSIQLGLLKPAVEEEGHEVDVFHLNVELAAQVGGSFYDEARRMGRELLMGEWLFSVAAFGYRPNEKRYRDLLPEEIERFCEDAGVDYERLCAYRNELLPTWIDEWSQAVDWDAYSVIGFTSTFQQNNSAFALARAIKEQAPETTIVFGGANFDGDMGPAYIQGLPFVDFAVVGEGDRALPMLIDRIEEGDSPVGVPGVVARSNGSVVGDHPAPPIQNMDGLPDPDYDDYFETLFRHGPDQVLGDDSPLLLLIETSRGCWWGENHHCTFCGLNALGMGYRSMSPEAAMGQMRRLSDRYRLLRFEAVDNILDYQYLSDVCGKLAEEEYDYRFFYEVKANLKREHLRTMAKAGIQIIQPGIEALNSHLLDLMRKGCTMLQNVRCLKWAHYYGIRVIWNLLAGFPGENREDFEDQLRILPLVRHLPAPKLAQVQLHRFSPYYDDDIFPIEDVRPLPAYRHVYPEGQFDLDDVAYFFDCEMDDVVPWEELDDLREGVREWRKAWSRKPRPELVYQRAPDWIQIIDRRTEDVRAHSFDGLEAEIYEHCSDTDRSRASVLRHVGADDEGDVDPATVDACLDEFCELGLMLEEDDRYLSLALPARAPLT